MGAFNHRNAPTVRIGLIGTGFIARGLEQAIRRAPWARISRVLTRRPRESVEWLDDARWTDSVAALVAESDVIVEASGDAIYATDVLLQVIDAGLPIITMNSELHVTTGSYFTDKCYLTEACGDQPGCFAALRSQALDMGFAPRAYINLKGFLNETPDRKEMQWWADRQKLRLGQVVQFTDGSKVQIEAALTANGLGADIAREGLIGGRVNDLKETDHFSDVASELDRPVSDYVLCKGAPPGVLVLAEHEDAGQLEHYTPFSNLKTAGGGYFMLMRPFHLCYLEILSSVRAVMAGAPPLLNNSAQPRIGVASVAKRALRSGEHVERGLGSFEVRGSAVRIAERPEHVPICLLADARLERDVAAGDILTFDDVDLPPSRALDLYRGILDRVITSRPDPLTAEVAQPRYE